MGPRSAQGDELVGGADVLSTDLEVRRTHLENMELRSGGARPLCRMLKVALKPEFGPWT
jgi:hypothetical protein